MSVVLRKKADKPCPRCYSPMVEDPAAADGWSCVKHGAPGSDGPQEAPPLPKTAPKVAVIAEISKNGATMPASAPPNRGGRTVKWTPENVIAAIVAWTDEHGRPPNSHDWGNAVDGHPACSTVYKLFGKPWENALCEAGVLNGQPPTDPGATRSDPEAPGASKHATGMPDPEPMEESASAPRPPEPEPTVEEQPARGLPDAPGPLGGILPKPALKEPKDPGAYWDPATVPFAEVAGRLERVWQDYQRAWDLWIKTCMEFEDHPLIDWMRGEMGPFGFEEEGLTAEQSIQQALRKLREDKGPHV